MNNNSLIVAAAGSGKTQHVIDEACNTEKNESVLIATYTESNEEEIRQRVIKKNGYVPSNITIQTWFSFLLQHGVRPYQSILNPEIHNEDIGFLLTSERSGKKLDTDGKPIISNGHPIFWSMEKNFNRFYFTSSFKIYSDKISKFVFECNKISNNEVIDRIARIYDHVFIDEVQDLAGYDLELLKLLFMSRSSTLLVGDPRQVTYLTHRTNKFGKYAHGRISDYFSNELGKRITCEIDDARLNVSHRNNQAICDYSAKLYPYLPAPMACTCRSCRLNVTDHEGVFLVRPLDVAEYLSRYDATQLRWDIKTKCNTDHSAINFGQAKGLSFDRVLIYPTTKMVSWIKDNNAKLKNETRAKLYVGVTRSRHSTAIVLNFNDDENFDGADKYFQS